MAIKILLILLFAAVLYSAYCFVFGNLTEEEEFYERLEETRKERVNNRRTDHVEDKIDPIPEEQIIPSGSSESFIKYVKSVMEKLK